MLVVQPEAQPTVQPLTVVSLSDAAASKLRELTAEETNPAMNRNTAMARRVGRCCTRHLVGGQ